MKHHAPNFTLHVGDACAVLKTLPTDSVDCVVTSPPYYGLRDYGVAGQIGLEESFDEFLARLVAVFDEVRRVLKPTGTCWVNMGDSYAGSWGAQGRQGASGEMAGRSVVSARQIAAGQRRTQTGSLSRLPSVKAKELLGQPWRLAFVLSASGWYLRQDIIWHKPNPMPESVRDRCTKAHEYLFLLTKAERYFWAPEFNREEGTRYAWNVQKFKGGDLQSHHKGSRGVESKDESAGRNRRSVWTVPTYPCAEAHFATFPPDLVKPCILAGCPVGGTVLDPFMGSGTTAMVAIELGRQAIGVELNPEYAAIAMRRTNVTQGLQLA